MIALVTDSTACLTPEDARRLNAHVVPHTYTDGSHIYAENYSGVGSGSYWKKRTARPCSAAYPPFKQLLRAFCSGATTFYAL